MRNLIRSFHELYINIEKLIRWIPIIWKDRWWDWAFLFTIIEKKMRLDANKYERWGMCADNQRIAKQLRMCAALLKRMSNDDYMLNQPKIGEYGETSNFSALQYEEYMKRQDIGLFCRMFQKHVFKWWE